MEGEKPASGARDLFDDADYLAYRAWQTDQVIALAEEIRSAVKANNPNTQVLHFAALDGSDADSRLIATSDGVLAGYASSDEDARERATRAAAFGKPVRGAIRAIAPDTVDPTVIAPRFAAWEDAGVTGVDVYNYGLMPGGMWDAVARR